MMSSWFTSSSQLDEQIDKATSSSLEDIALNLEISDIIRSKSVGSKEAMRSLKKRLESKNPNTQLSTLNLTDTCVKNGGSHFLSEIASREYIDNLVSLMKAHGGGVVNEDVKTKILELIQSWATATEGQQEFSYIGETYNSLLREGFHFPPKVDVAKSMLVSSAPPEWTDSDVCMRCRAAFTFTNRKHHCRNCGHVFDHQCSSKTLPLPHFGITQAVRVDDGCYIKLTHKPTRGYPLTDERLPNQLNVLQRRSSSSMKPRSARVEDVFDEDFKKALAMSLEEYKGHSGIESVQKSSQTSTYPKINGSTQALPSRSFEEEEEDKDLKSAIAASLADMEEQKKKHSEKIKEKAGIVSSHNTCSLIPPINDHTLTPVEVENVNLFSNLVDRLQMQPPGAVLKEPQIQELYENIVKLRPKIARTYGETMSKHDSLLDLHAKLSTVVRYYDRLLEQRLSNTYSQHSIGRYSLPPRSNSSITTTISQDILNGSTEGFYTSNFQTERRPKLPSNYESQISDSNNEITIKNYRPASGPSTSEHDYIQYSQPQRGSSWNISVPSVPLASQHSIYSEKSKYILPSTQQNPQFIDLPQSQLINEPSESLSSLTSDPNVAFYHNSMEPSTPHSSNLQHQSSVSESTPQTSNKLLKTFNHQPLSRNSPPQSVQEQALPYQQQVPSQQRLVNINQQWHSAPHLYNNCNPDNFPQAPQNTLKQPIAEECLIEL